MRIQSLSTCFSIANLVAGALAVIAFWLPSIQFTIVLLALALVTCVLVNGWVNLRFRKSLKLLVTQARAANPVDVHTGIAELDDIGRQLAKSIQQAQQASYSDSQELDEIKLLLANMDRRQDGAIDRDGFKISPATRLGSVIKGYTAELDSGIRQVVSCGREIHRATEELVSGSEAQSDIVIQTTSVIEQLSTRVFSISDNTEELMASSTKAQETARDGLQQFQELVNELKQIRNHAAARERRLQALGEHTKEIDSIVQTIGTLSSRTDLLALNASIESVRAGEHGRGFAIVAEEVRALAEQSAQAVLDITNRIEMIQLETHQSISAASGEHDQMHEVVQKVTDTLEFLKAICNATSESTQHLSEISDATNHQLQLTEAVIATLERSTDSSKMNRSRAEGAHWTAKTFKQLGTQLENSLVSFRALGTSSLHQEPAQPVSTSNARLLDNTSAVASQQN